MSNEFWRDVFAVVGVIFTFIIVIGLFNFIACDKETSYIETEQGLVKAEDYRCELDTLFLKGEEGAFISAKNNTLVSCTAGVIKLTKKEYNQYHTNPEMRKIR